MQFLLFSATFNEIIKDYALRVTADNGKEEVNQVGCQPPSPLEALRISDRKWNVFNMRVSLRCCEVSCLRETGLIPRRSLCQGRTSHWMSSSSTKW